MPLKINLAFLFIIIGALLSHTALAKDNSNVAKDNYVSTQSSNKQKRQLQKSIKTLEKELNKLRSVEKQLSAEENAIKKQAWAEAGKRKQRRNTTKVKRKERKILEKLTAKRNELAEVEREILNTQKRITSYNKQIASLNNKGKSTPIAKVEKEPEPNVKPSKKQSSLNKETKKWLGTPYRYGGTTKSGVDCSGFTCEIYKQVYGITLPRTSSDQHNNSKKVSKKSLKTGDLVFFKIKKSKVNHVGIYVGNNEFIHASSSRGVVVSNLSETYYQKYFIGGGRY